MCLLDQQPGRHRHEAGEVAASGSLANELRLLLGSKSEVLSAVIQIVMRVVLGWSRQRARDPGLGTLAYSLHRGELRPI